MTDTAGASHAAKWHMAHGPDADVRREVRAKFRRLYEAKGRPEGAALYEGIDSTGKFGGMCVTPQAAVAFPELFEDPSPWYSYDHRPTVLNWGWVDGDERLKTPWSLTSLPRGIRATAILWATAEDGPDPYHRCLYELAAEVACLPFPLFAPNHASAVRQCGCPYSPAHRITSPVSSAI